MDLYQVVKDFGFPVAFGLIYLFRIEPAINELRQTIGDLKSVLLSINGDSAIGENLRRAELERQRARAILEGTRG